MKQTNIDKVVEVLSSAFKADPIAISALLQPRVNCNETLANHPKIPVESMIYDEFDKKTYYYLGIMGLINGIVHTLTGELVATKWEGNKLVGFQKYERVPVSNKKAKTDNKGRSGSSNKKRKGSRKG
jgi:hypothetical protein